MGKTERAILEKLRKESVKELCKEERKEQKEKEQQEEKKDIENLEHNKLNWKEAKEVLRKLYEKNQGKMEINLPNTKEETHLIKILAEKQNKESIYLAMPKIKGNKTTLEFFDDERETGRIDEEQLTKAIIKEYYRYDAVLINGSKEEIVCLSENQVNAKEEIIAKGIMTSKIGKLKVNEEAEIPKQNKIFIIKETNQKEKDIQKIIRPIKQHKTEKQLKEAFFGKYRQPNWFENMIISWIFSTNKYEYPLHIMLADNSIKAKQQGSTGKTTLIKTILEKTESGILCDLASGGMTFKGLTASNAGNGNKVRLGYLLTQDRFAGLDEIFQIKEGNGERTGNVAESFGGLTSILDNTPFYAGSGQTEQTKVYPRVKVIAAGNMPYGAATLEDIKATIPTQYLQRNLCYIYTEEHRKHIKEQYKKGLLITQTKECNIGHLSEYLTNNLSLKLEETTINKIMQIIDKLKEQIQGNEYDDTERSAFFENRYPHHALCLIDGIIKKNNWNKLEKLIIQRKEHIKIKPTEQDYKELEEILTQLVRSW